MTRLQEPKRNQRSTRACKVSFKIKNKSKRNGLPSFPSFHLTFSLPSLSLPYSPSPSLSLSRSPLLLCCFLSLFISRYISSLFLPLFLSSFFLLFLRED